MSCFYRRCLVRSLETWLYIRTESKSRWPGLRLNGSFVCVCLCACQYMCKHCGTDLCPSYIFFYTNGEFLCAFMASSIDRRTFNNSGQTDMFAYYSELSTLWCHFELYVSVWSYLCATFCCAQTLMETLCKKWPDKHSAHYILPSGSLLVLFIKIEHI